MAQISDHLNGKNIAIENLSKEMGKEIIDTFKALGFDTRDLGGKAHKGNSTYYYYGVYNGMFDNYRKERVESINMEIVSLDYLKSLVPKEVAIKNLSLEMGKDIIRLLTRLGAKNPNRWEGINIHGTHTDSYYGIINGNIQKGTEEKFKNHKIITMEELKDLTKETGYTITPAQATSIVDIACNDWKIKLSQQWAVNIILKKNIKITEEEYVLMRSACNQAQHDLFDSIFGGNPYKEGDYVEFDGKSWKVLESDKSTVRFGGIGVHFWRVKPAKVPQLQPLKHLQPVLVTFFNKSGQYLRFAAGKVLDDKHVIYNDGKKEGNVSYYTPDQIQVFENSIIGKKYTPFDNSYTVNLTSASNYPYNNDTSAYLAGNMVGEPSKECVILSEPFICKVNTASGKKEEREMIIVLYGDESYSVLYNPKGIK